VVSWYVGWVRAEVAFAIAFFTFHSASYNKSTKFLVFG